ncbi:MAG: protein kinase, partial [Planctomycetota bacterium]
MSDHDSQYDPTIPRSGGRHSRRHAETTPNDPPLPTRPASPRRVNVPLPPATRQIPPPLPAPPPSSMSRSGTSHRVAAAAANLQDNALARFAFGEELGRGGMGVVRAAEDTSLRRPLAIKLLQSPTVDGDEVAQFIEEAQITAQLEHPNIVPVHELGRDASGRPWLAMKRIEGVSLAERIEEWRRRARSRPLAAEDIHSILSLFDKVCDALAFAHSRRVIHRDIKPANIMVGSFGEVLLVDWGLARPLDAGDGRDSFVRSSRREGGEQMTMQGDVFGTPAFMPPEQAEGLVDEIDQRSDIFSLGGVLYNMLTLEVPYDSATGASRALVMAARWQLVPPRRRAPQRHIPRELDAIVMKAMAADPADRYRSVQALKDDLAAWQSLRPTTAWRAGPIDRLVKLMRRNPTWSLSAAVLVLASLVVVMLVQQLAASEQALALAEAREAQQTAQRERAEADARARAADAEKAHEREVAALERERLLRQLAPVQVTKDRDAAIDAFYAEIEQARQRGMNTRRHIINMDESKVREALDAFNRFERMANATEGLSMTADDFCTRGMLKWKLRDWKDAIADFTAALDLDPHHHDSLEWRGMTWLDTGDVQLCVDDMTRLFEMDPRRLSAWLNRGYA